MYQKSVVRLNVPSAHADVDAWPEYATRHTFTMEPVAKAGKKAFAFTTAVHDVLWFMTCTFLLLFTQSPEFREVMKPAESAPGLVQRHGVFVEGNTTVGVRYLKDILGSIGHELVSRKDRAAYVARINAETHRLGSCRGNVGDVSVSLRLTLFADGKEFDSVDTVNRHRLMPCDTPSYANSISDFVRDIVRDIEQDPYIVRRLVFDSNAE